LIGYLLLFVLVNRENCHNFFKIQFDPHICNVLILWDLILISEIGRSDYPKTPLKTMHFVIEGHLGLEQKMDE